MSAFTIRQMLPRGRVGEVHIGRVYGTDVNDRLRLAYSVLHEAEKELHRWSTLLYILGVITTAATVILILFAAVNPGGAQTISAVIGAVVPAGAVTFLCNQRRRAHAEWSDAKARVEEILDAGFEAAC